MTMRTWTRRPNSTRLHKGWGIASIQRYRREHYPVNAESPPAFAKVNSRSGLGRAPQIPNQKRNVTYRIFTLHKTSTISRTTFPIGDAGHVSPSTCDPFVVLFLCGQAWQLRFYMPEAAGISIALRPSNPSRMRALSRCDTGKSGGDFVTMRISVRVHCLRKWWTLAPQPSRPF